MKMEPEILIMQLNDRVGELEKEMYRVLGMIEKQLIINDKILEIFNVKEVGNEKTI